MLISVTIAINPPAPLTEKHIIATFDCGNDDLNKWLQQRALKSEGQTSRTYVVTTVNNIAIAYYCLAFGSISHEIATSKVKRNTPSPIPAMVVGRLATDKAWQGRGIGRSLLKDAIIRSLQAAEVAGLRAMFVHAIDQEAKDFYLKWGFSQSPMDEMTLMITLHDARLALTSDKILK
jgi:GNAT superfamily N-acetyltransferase